MAKYIRRVGSDSRPPPVDTGVVPYWVDRETIGGLRSSPDEYVSDRNESLDAALKLERDIQQLKFNVIKVMEKYIDEKAGAFLYRAKIERTKDQGRLDL